MPPLGAIPAAGGISAGGVPSPGPGPGAAALTAVERLAEIPGVSPELAMAIIAGTGLALTRFPAAGHLASRAGLAPAARQCGPRHRQPKKGAGRRLPQGLPHPGRQRRRPHRDPPRRTAPPPQQPPGREQGQMRRGPPHPDHHLAPARQPRSPVHRPRSRLARTQNRPRP